MHGRGALLTKVYTGECVLYEGYWCNGKKEGKGRVTSPIGTVYEGGIKDNMCHGEGVYLFEQGNVINRYEGQFEGDLMNGTGTIYYTDGTKYVGEIKNDRKHG